MVGVFIIKFNCLGFFFLAVVLEHKSDLVDEPFSLDISLKWSRILIILYPFRQKPHLQINLTQLRTRRSIQCKKLFNFLILLPTQLEHLVNDPLPGIIETNSSIDKELSQ